MDTFAIGLALTISGVILLGWQLYLILRGK
jgi:hypothetical protein